MEKQGVAAMSTPVVTVSPQEPAWFANDESCGPNGRIRFEFGQIVRITGIESLDGECGLVMNGRCYPDGRDIYLVVTLGGPVDVQVENLIPDNALPDPSRETLTQVLCDTIF